MYAAFARAWLAHYGPPGLVIADQGREFVGREFADRLGHLGVPVHYISARAPWENGRTERAGGIYKSRLETAIHEVGGVTSEEEFKTAISETSMMHNRYYNRSGYTPYQRAFGTLPRLPASLLSDDKIDKQLILESGEDAMKRAWRIREEAGKAWLKWQDDTAVRRAVSTRTRTVDMKAFEDGELVYVWRDIPGHKGWTGPGTIIAQKGDACWISMRGYLMKANKGQVRKATSEESLGAELVKHLSTTLLEDIENNRVKFFRDVAAEGLPDDDAMSGEVIGRLAEAEGDSPEVVEPAEAYSPTTPLNTWDRIDEGDEDFEMDLGDQHPLRDQAQVQPDQGVQPMLEDPPRRAPSEASTAEPSTAEVAPSVPPSLTTSQPQSRRESMNIRVDEARDGVLGFGPVRRDQQRPVMPYPCPPQGVPALPRNTRSLYFEVSKEPSEESPHWIRDRCTGHYTMNNASTEKFNISQSTGVFNYNDKCIYLTKAKTSPGQVEFRKLEEKYKKIFRASRAKEVQSLLDSGAIKILSKEESKRFLREHPQHVLTSRYVDRWKPTDAFGVLPEEYGEPGFLPEQHPGLAPKSRWCVVGWRDPHIHQIERTAPTPLTSSIYLALQLAASRKWKAKSKDAKTAVLQSRPTTRSQKLACRMPADEAFEGYDVEQLILLLTEVYGLVSGPSWWRRSLLEILVKELGYRVNVYDRCVLTLDQEENKDFKDPNTPTRGILVLEVDDMLEAGDSVHRQKMELLEKRLRFGKVVDLQNTEGGSGYAGRRLRQLKDFSFEYSMDDYVANRLQKANITRKFLKKDAAKIQLNEEEESQLRGTIAAINWAAREGRPDGSASASILSGCFPNPTLQNVLDCNATVEMLKERSITIKIHAIPEAELRHVLVADSSFDPTGKSKPQHGWLQGVTTPALNRGQFAPVSLISWRRKKLRRKAASTTLCESISLSTALASLEKQAATMKSFRFSRYDPSQVVEDMDVLMGLRGPPVVISTEDPRHQDPEAVAIIDAKSVYDSTASSERQFQGDDDRAALEAAMIQESLAKLRARLRWLPHNLNPADSLTKLPSAAHMAPLYTLLQKKGMVIQQEEIELATGRQGDRRQKVHGPAAMSSEYAVDVHQPTMSVSQNDSTLTKFWEAEKVT